MAVVLSKSWTVLLARSILVTSVLILTDTPLTFLKKFGSRTTPTGVVIKSFSSATASDT